MKKLSVSLAILAIIMLSGCGTTTKDGEHTIYVTAVEKNGLIWKTGRAYVKTDLSSSQEEYYCVENQEVYNKLKEASINKNRTTLKFHSEMIIAPWRCDSENAIVDEIK